jgi:hypothetical protein
MAKNNVKRKEQTFEANDWLIVAYSRPGLRRADRYLDTMSNNYIPHIQEQIHPGFLHGQRRLTIQHTHQDHGPVNSTDPNAPISLRHQTPNALPGSPMSPPQSKEVENLLRTPEVDDYVAGRLCNNDSHSTPASWQSTQGSSARFARPSGSPPVEI